MDSATKQAITDILVWLGWALGFASSVIAIYQWGQLNERKRSLRNYQYLLAAMNGSAIMKQMRWANNRLLLVQGTDPEVLRVYETAISDMADLAQQAYALERSIDSNSSAIRDMQQEAVEQMARTNEMAAANRPTAANTAQ